jgi:hypothetical protein
MPKLKCKLLGESSRKTGPGPLSRGGSRVYHLWPCTTRQAVAYATARIPQQMESFDGKEMLVESIDVKTDYFDERVQKVRVTYST